MSYRPSTSYEDIADDRDHRSSRSDFVAERGYNIQEPHYESRHSSRGSNRQEYGGKWERNKSGREDSNAGNNDRSSRRRDEERFESRDHRRHRSRSLSPARRRRSSTSRSPIPAPRDQADSSGLSPPRYSVASNRPRASELNGLDWNRDRRNSHRRRHDRHYSDEDSKGFSAARKDREWQTQRAAETGQIPDATLIRGGKIKDEYLESRYKWEEEARKASHSSEYSHSGKGSQGEEEDRKVGLYADDPESKRILSGTERLRDFERDARSESAPLATADEAAEVEDEMAAMMGFKGFDTTAGKQVQEDVAAVKIKQERKFRQYMNRKGGFNRPLDKIK